MALFKTGDAMFAVTKQTALQLALLAVGLYGPSHALGQDHMDLGERKQTIDRYCNQSPRPASCDSTLAPFALEPQVVPFLEIPETTHPQIRIEREDAYGRYCNQTPRPKGCDLIPSKRNPK
jgi:hypothetical protein